MGCQMNNKDIIETLKFLPNKIKQQQTRLLTFAFDIESNKTALQKSEDDAMLLIVEQKDENNKSIYANETARQLALRKLLSAQAEHQKLLDALQESEGLFREEKIELEYLQNTMASMRSISRIIGAGTE